MNCNQNMTQNCCFDPCCSVQPIVMPAQVITKRKVSFCEQPVIFPVELRTVNQVVMVPKYYRTYVQNCHPQCCMVDRNDCQ